MQILDNHSAVEKKNLFSKYLIDSFSSLEFYSIVLQYDATLIVLINYFFFFFGEKFRDGITSSRAVKSQLTAISLSTEEQATWKDSPKNRDSISLEKDCCIPLSKSFDAYGVKKNSKNT